MRTKLGLIALQRYMHVVHVLTLDTKCMSFVCDGKPFLRVLVVGKKVNTSLQDQRVLICGLLVVVSSFKRTEDSTSKSSGIPYVREKGS